jgi:hypothetical protein
MSLPVRARAFVVGVHFVRAILIFAKQAAAISFALVLSRATISLIIVVKK